MSTTADFVQTLRDVADWYERHPDVPLPTLSHGILNVYPEEQPAEIARMIGSCDKDVADSWFYLRKTFGEMSLDFNWPRQLVCTPRVVGERLIPAQEARIENVIEWDCPRSILE